MDPLHAGLLTLAVVAIMVALLALILTIMPPRGDGMF